MRTKIALSIHIWEKFHHDKSVILVSKATFSLSELEVVPSGNQ
jgi:hypothetical protein